MAQVFLTCSLNGNQLSEFWYAFYSHTCRIRLAARIWKMINERNHWRLLGSCEWFDRVLRIKDGNADVLSRFFDNYWTIFIYSTLGRVTWYASHQYNWFKSFLNKWIVKDSYRRKLIGKSSAPGTVFQLFWTRFC